MRVEATALTKSFGRIQALRGVDLDIAAGRRVALIGPNGSGKSTLIRALLGLVECQGEVRLDGLSPWQDRLRTARRAAYVPQVAPQLAAPVGELVRAVAGVRGLDSGEIAAMASRLDLDVASVARQPFRSLSGGMKQKLLISLALACRAELLVMDEPTASLDVASRDRFFALFDEVAPTATLILCSHRLEEIQHMVDDVVALTEGRVSHAGPALAWLAQRAASVVEVRLHGTFHDAEVSSLGFARGRGGWWWRSATRAETVSLASAIALRFGGDVEDLVVRHVEKVDAAVEVSRG